MIRGLRSVAFLAIAIAACSARAAAPVESIDAPTSEPGGGPAATPAEPAELPTSEAGNEQLPQATATEPTAAVEPAHIAYLGPDDNVWVVTWPGGTPRQLTTDAASDPSGPSISYYFPRISSDGGWVAYRRDQGIPGLSGLDFSFGLWVFDLDRGESRQVLDLIPAGFAWQPGTHVLAYGVSVPQEYFIARGQPSPELARGIQGVDLDTGQTGELAPPERGYALVSPSWSPDGRILSFQELFNMEGSGLFAYVDLDTAAYTAWDQAIGLIDWSPDGSQLAYDSLTYAANGTEQIFLHGLAGGETQAFTPQQTPAYTFSPRFSPSGEQIAYLASLDGPDGLQFSLFLQPATGGTARALGVFESVQDLAWTPDGTHLLFSAGPFDQQQLMAVEAATGAAGVITPGWQPSVSR